MAKKKLPLPTPKNPSPSQQTERGESLPLPTPQVSSVESEELVEEPLAGGEVASEQVTREQSVFQQELPVGVASNQQLDQQEAARKTPYELEVDSVLQDARGKVDSLYKNVLVPAQQERYNELTVKYAPLVNTKKEEIQAKLNDGKISEEEANKEFQEYVAKIDGTATNQAELSTSANKKYQEELQKLTYETKKSVAKINREANQADELKYNQMMQDMGSMESMGNALYNEWVKTKMIPAQTGLVLEQFTEGLEGDISLPSLVWDKDGIRIESMTSAERQQKNLKQTEDLREDLLPTKQFITSIESDDWDGAAAAAVGGTINLLGSMGRGYVTKGASFIPEMTEPMLAESIKKKAEEKGISVEEVIQKDLEDELTPMTIGVVMGLGERYGAKIAGKVLSDPFKKAVAKEVKKSTFRLMSEETGIEVLQSGLEKGTEESLDKGGIKSKEGLATLGLETLKFLGTKEAAEVAITTGLGVTIMGVASKGTASTYKYLRGKRLDTKDIGNILKDYDQTKKELEGLYVAGKISEQEYEDAIKVNDQIKGTEGKLSPENKNKAKSVELIFERERLKEEAEEKDETQRGGYNRMIQEIDDQLVKLSQTQEDGDKKTKENQEGTVQQELQTLKTEQDATQEPSTEEAAPESREAAPKTSTQVAPTQVAPTTTESSKESIGLQKRIDKAKKDFAAATDTEGKVKAVVNFFNDATVSTASVSNEDMAWYEASKAELEAEGYVFDNEIGRELPDNEIVEVGIRRKSDQVPKGVTIIESVKKPRRVVDGKLVEIPSYDVIEGTGTTTERDALAAEVKSIKDSMTPQNIKETRPKLNAANKALKEYDAANFTSPIQTEINTTEETTTEGVESSEGLTEEVNNKLTEDGEGNYVFYHYSPERRVTLKPSAGDARNLTSREEAAALSSVGGVVMFYTDKNTGESGMGSEQHIVKIPKNKVYYLQSDVDGFYEEAKRRFKEKFPTQAFSSNHQAAWVGKLAEEAGYEMLVSKWGNNKLRAQTTKEVTPLSGDEASVVYEPNRSNEVHEVGDKIKVYGGEGVITDIKDGTYSYKGENVSGTFSENSLSEIEILEKGTTNSKKSLFNKPVAVVKKVATKIKKTLGITDDGGENITKIDSENSKKIADAYDAMKHDPNNPKVREAYEAMAKETIEQYKAIVDEGVVFEIYVGKGEPYANSKEMLADLEKGHLFILATESDFGTAKITNEQRKENPLLRDSGIKDVNGKPLLVNDIFRGVHDFFGHGERGNGFGAIGEENAWDVHSRMYSEKARRAMTTETRGQNSWVNFGNQMRNKDGSIKKKGDEGYMSPMERPFAEQKIGLLPNWVSKTQTNQEGSTTKEEKVKSPAKTTTSETEGLTTKETFKQGFEEYTQAAKEKAKERTEKAVKKVTDRIEAIKAKAKDKKALQKEIFDAIKELAPKGTKITPSVAKKIISAKDSKSMSKIIDKVLDDVRRDKVRENKKEVKSLLKDILKKARKGNFTNVKEFIEDLGDFDWQSLNDLDSQEKAIEVLKDLNKSVSKFNVREVADLKYDLMKKAGIKEAKVQPNKGAIEEALIKLEAPTTRNDFRDNQRVITRTEQALEEAVEKGTITLKEQNKIEDLIEAAQERLESQAKEMRREFVLEGEESMKETKMAQVEPNYLDIVKEFFQESRKGISLKNADMFSQIAFDILNGYYPVKQMQDYITSVRSDRDARELSDTINKATEKRDSNKRIQEFMSKQVWIPQWMKKAGFKDSLEEAIKDLKKVDVAFFDDFFGTGKSEIVYDKLISPIVTAINKMYDTSSKQYDKYISSKYKGNRGVRISKKQKLSDTKTLMAMHQEQWNAREGGDYWWELLSNEDYKNSNKKEWSRVKEAYESMPKKEDGRVDGEAYLKGLKGKEKQAYNAFVNVNKEQSKRQRIANERDGKAFEEVDPKYYVPIKRDGLDFFSGDHSAYIDQVLEGGKTNIKLTSDQGKQRVSMKVEPIELDMDRLAAGTIFDTNREYFLKPAAREVAKTGGKAIREIKGTHPRNYMRAIVDPKKGAINSRLKNEFAQSSKLSKAFNRFMSGLYKNALVRFIRMGAEVGAEGTRMIGDANIDRFGEAINLRLTGIEGNSPTKGEGITRIMEFTGSPFLHNLYYESNSDRKRESATSSRTIQGKIVKAIDKRTSNIMAFPDDLTFNIVWLPQFLESFESVTGSKFDTKEYSKAPDKYLEDNKSAIKKASNQADAKTEKLKGAKTKFGKRETVSVLGLGRLSQDNSVAKIINILQNFAFLEQLNLARNLRETMYAENKGSGRAARALVAGVASGTLYTWTTQVGYALMSYYSSDDDEEQEKSLEQIEKMTSVEGLVDSVMGNATFLLGGRYGNLGKTAILVGLGAYLEIEKGRVSKSEYKELAEEIGGFTKSRYFAEPINISGYNSIGDVVKSAFPFTNRLASMVGDPIKSVGRILNKDGEFEDKEVQAAANLANDIQKLILLSQGTQIPFQKEIDNLIKIKEEKAGSKDGVIKVSVGLKGAERPKSNKSKLS